MKHFILIISALLLCLALSGCGGSSVPASTRENDTTAHSRKETANIGTESGTSSGNFWQDLFGENQGSSAPTGATKGNDALPAEVRTECFSAYLKYLQDHKDSAGGTYTFAHSGTRMTVQGTIMFWDLTGDGLAEMLIVSPSGPVGYSDPLGLYVYTYRDGSIEEITLADGNCAIQFFWDQTNDGYKYDSVCFSSNGSVYVNTILWSYAESFETLLRLGYDAETGFLTTDPILKKSEMTMGVYECYWYIGDKEVPKENYDKNRAALFEQADACILMPQAHSSWKMARAGEDLPKETYYRRESFAGRTSRRPYEVVTNSWGMQYEEALNFLTEELKAFEEETLTAPETIYLGKFDQDGNPDNGLEPIEWIVLAKENGRALVLSRYGLESMSYLHNSNASVRITWATSGIRNWLNESFFSDAFTDEEEARILISEIISEDNPVYGKPGNMIRTEDHVFLLSNKEVETYLPTHSLRVCAPTTFAHTMGSLPEFGGGTQWILRSFGGYGELSVSCVDPWGFHNTFGTNNDNRYAIRPAMWIRTD